MARMKLAARRTTRGKRSPGYSRFPSVDEDARQNKKAKQLNPKQAHAVAQLEPLHDELRNAKKEQRRQVNKVKVELEQHLEGLKRSYERKVEATQTKFKTVISRAEGVYHPKIAALREKMNTICNQAKLEECEKCGKHFPCPTKESGDNGSATSNPHTLCPTCESFFKCTACHDWIHAIQKCKDCGICICDSCSERCAQCGDDAMYCSNCANDFCTEPCGVRTCELCHYRHVKFCSCDEFDFF